MVDNLSEEYRNLKNNLMMKDIFGPLKNIENAKSHSAIRRENSSIRYKCGATSTIAKKHEES